jgi:hypothetical protein
MLDSKLCVHPYVNLFSHSVGLKAAGVFWFHSIQLSFKVNLMVLYEYISFTRSKLEYASGRLQRMTRNRR